MSQTNINEENYIDSQQSIPNNDTQHYESMQIQDNPIDSDIFNHIYAQSKDGYFGDGEHSFGGCFVPEILYPAMLELQEAYNTIFKSKDFKKELKSLLKHFVGRPTPLIYAKNASNILGNEIYLKFEGLANTGAHKINNAIAQILLAKKMGKKSIIAETGAGQHGVAVSSVCAYLGMPCKIFMGEIDVNRQRPNVFIMQQFGSEVIPVSNGSKTLKDAVNEALRYWSRDPLHSFYVLGSALGPSPYPDIVRDSQAIIGKEIKKQILKAIGKLPDFVIACVGGGSNAMGAFSALLQDPVRLIGIEAGGNNFMPNYNAMRLSDGSSARIGIAHGYKSLFLQDTNGQIAHTHSISAGLDYAGISPQLAHLKSINRVEFHAASDKEALSAMQFFAKHEGMLSALESAHALAGAIKLSKTLQGKTIVVNVSGRGDKDIFITAKALYAKEWKDFLEHEIQDINKSLKAKQNIANNIPTQNIEPPAENLLTPLLEELNDSDLAFLDDIDNIDSKNDCSNVKSQQTTESIDLDDILANIDNEIDINKDPNECKEQLLTQTIDSKKSHNKEESSCILSEDDLQIMDDSYDKMEHALSLILDKSDTPTNNTQKATQAEQPSNEFSIQEVFNTQTDNISSENDVIHKDNKNIQTKLSNVAQLDYAKTFELPPALSKIIGKSLRS